MKRTHIEILVLSEAIALLLVVIGSHFLPSAKNKEFKLEVVTTPEAMVKGLGGRSSLPADTGMLFKWEDSRTRCMWNRDVTFDVDVVFLDASGKALQLDSMKAGSTEPHCSAQPAQMALEVNAGAFN